MNSIKTFFILSLTFLILTAQAQVSKIKTQKTPGGLEYKIFNPKKGPRIVAGDLVFFKMKGKISDSILFNTYKNSKNPGMSLPVQDNFKKGNFEEGLSLLTIGDSAMFVINADSFFNVYTAGPPPAFAKKGDPIYFFIKVDSFVTKKVLAERKATQELEMVAKQNNEVKLIEEYIKSTGKVFTKTSSGLYYIITKKTEGPKANSGDKVAAVYTGKLLDGKVFDSNQASGQPFEFNLGAHMVIAGWDEIFSILNEGESATIVLPSSLGYGARGAGPDIGPYSPLIFDVEFVKFTKQ
jgi:FKBP-type peptidyl-prolyl cis-trans isomerase FkpA